MILINLKSNLIFFLRFSLTSFTVFPVTHFSWFENKKCKKIEFEKGIKQADFITVHIPLNEKTKNIINYDLLKNMKKKEKQKKQIV